MLQRQARTLRKTAKALTDPRPEFVSLVFAGANKSPFRALRADGLEEGMEPMADTSAIKAETHAIARVDFFQTHFADEAAVKAWLEDGGYVGMKVEKTDSGFAVVGDTADNGQVIDLSDTLGLKMTVVSLREAPLELTEVVVDTLEPALKADEVNPGANDDVPGVAEMRAKYCECFDSAPCVSYSKWGKGETVGTVLDNNFDGVPPGLLDVTMATYDAIRNNLVNDDVVAARACVGEFANLFDRMLAMFPVLSEKGAPNDGPRVDPNIMNGNGTIQGPGVANAKPNVENKPKPKGVDGTETAIHDAPTDSGAINANGNLEAVANPTGAHEDGTVTPDGDGKASVVHKRKKAFLAAVAPEITVTKETTETTTADPAVVTPEVPVAVVTDVVEDSGAAPVVAEKSETIEITSVVAEAVTDEVVAETVVKADEAVDPIVALTALVGELAQSVKAVQETVSAKAEVLAERVAAIEDVRQTRKGADVDEANVATAAPETTAQTEMAEMRTRGVLGMRSLPPKMQR